MSVRIFCYKFLTVSLVSAVLCLPLMAEVEPNDELAQANPAAVGDSIQISFAKKGDRDCFKIKCPGDGVLRVVQKQKSETHEWVCPAFFRDGKSFRDNRWGGAVKKGEEIIIQFRSAERHWHEKVSPEVVDLELKFEPFLNDEEPNNNPEQAIEVTPGEVFDLSFNPLYDRDFFKVKAPGNGVMRVTQLKKSQVHDFATVWWVRDGSIVRDQMWDSACKENEWLVFGLRSSHYSWHERESADRVQFKVLFEPEKTDEEPNNTPERAKLIRIDEPFRFQLNPRYDRDYFKIEMPDDGVLRLHQTKKSEDHGEAWRSWYRNGKEIRGGEWDVFGYKGESVLLVVRSANHSWHEKASEEVLEMMVSFEPAKKGAEPNNSPTEAKEVTLGKSFEVVLNPRLDRDYFKVTSPGHGSIKMAQLKKSPAHGLVTPRWFKNGQYVNNGQNDIAVLHGEEVIVEVRSAAHSWNEKPSKEPFKIVLLFSPEKSKGEPNGTPETAEYLELGEDRELIFSPRYDRDYFSVMSDKAGVLTINRLDDRKAHPHAWIWWDDGSGAEKHGGNWQMRIEENEPRIFGLRSAAHSWSEVSSDHVLKIKAEWSEDPDASEPNNQFATAINLAPDGSNHELVLFPSIDLDLFKIVASQDGAIMVENSSGLNLNWILGSTGKKRTGSWVPCSKGETILLTVGSTQRLNEPLKRSFKLVSGTEEELGVEPVIPVRRWSFNVNPEAE